MSAILTEVDGSATNGTILVALDKSMLSQHGLSLAIKIASRLKKSITLIHAIDLAKYTPVAPAAVDSRSMLQDLMTSGQALLEDAELVVKQTGVQCVSKMPHGKAEDALLANVNDATLIVMGHHGRSGLDYYQMGSVAESVLRNSPVPLLTVRSVDNDLNELSKVLVPVDGSPHGFAALRKSIPYAKLFASQLTALHVVKKGSHVTVNNDQVMKEVNEISQSLKVQIDINILESDDEAATAICDVGKGFDLICLGSHGRSGLSHLIFGSVTEKVMRDSRSCILAFGWKSLNL